MAERRIFDAACAVHRYDAALLEEHCSVCGDLPTSKTPA
jgi:hypothetical protein